MKRPSLALVLALTLALPALAQDRQDVVPVPAARDFANKAIALWNKCPDKNCKETVVRALQAHSKYYAPCHATVIINLCDKSQAVDDALWQVIGSLVK